MGRGGSDASGRGTAAASVSMSRLEPPPRPAGTVENATPADGVGFTLFHSPHEFLLLRDTDQRVAVLAEQVKADARADSLLPWYKRMVSFPVQRDSMVAMSGSWLNLAALVLALLSFFAYVSQLAVLPAVVRFDVRRLCVEEDSGSFAYRWAYDIGTIVGALLVEVAALAVVAVQARVLGGWAPWWRLYSRHLMQMLVVSHRPLLALTLASVAVYAWTLGFSGVLYAVLLVASVPAVDAGFETHGYAWTTRLGMLGVVATFFGTWVRTRLQSASCERLDKDLTLYELAQVTVSESAILLYSITVAGIVLRRVIHPRRPLSTSPRAPYVSVYYGDEGPRPKSSAFVPFEVRFGKFGLAVFPVGSPEAIAHGETETAPGQWIIQRERSHIADILAMGSGVLLSLSYIAQAVSVAVVLGTTANVDERCFDDTSASLTVAMEVLRNVVLVSATLLLACGLWSWRRAVRDPWISLFRFCFRWWLTQRTFVVSAVLYTALAIPGGYPLFASPIVSVFLLPLLAAVLVTSPPFLSGLTRILAAMSSFAALLGYARVAIYSSNLCSTMESRKSVAVFIAYSLTQAADSVWLVSLVKAFAKKISDGTDPMMAFQLEPAVGHQNHWLEDAGVTDHRSGTRPQRGATLVLQTRLRSGTDRGGELGSSRCEEDGESKELAQVGADRGSRV